MCPSPGSQDGWTIISCSSSAPWALGSSGDSCDTACGGSCVDGSWGVVDEASFEAAMAAAGESTGALCSSGYDTAVNNNCPLIAGSHCYSAMEASQTCSESHTGYQRLCRCGGSGGGGGDGSCNGGSVNDLARLRSPLSGDTSGSGDNYELSCGGRGNEAIFSLQLQPGQSVDIGMDSNTYDSRHETSWGGDCPGTNVVTCTDDPDTTRHQWTNDQGSVQTVFFVIDAYSSGSGAFTLSWTMSSSAPAQPACATCPTSCDDYGTFTTFSSLVTAACCTRDVPCPAGGFPATCTAACAVPLLPMQQACGGTSSMLWSTP